MRAAIAALVISLAVIVLAGPCPNNCSNHGSCGGAPPKCTCQQGWAGDDCSEAVTALSANKAVNGQVGSRLWNFYSYLMAHPGSALTFSANQTSAGDCDLYLKAGNLPTRYDYDQRDIGTGTSMTLGVKTSAATTYYLGVFGYTGCSYVVGVFVAGGGTSSCPNGCSGHGSCNSQGVCNCQAGWSGADCSISMNQLVPNRPQSTSVLANNWNFYYFNITATTSVAQVIVNQTSSSMDCDLYIKQGSPPTRFSYDFSDKSDNQNFALSISQPALGSWYAGVTGFTDCTYTITLSLNTQSCPPGSCSNHGSCRTGSAQCICSPGYNGNNCENMLAPLTDGQVASGYSASSSSWNYFHYLAFAADNVIATLNRVSTPGSCALYAKAGSNPSPTRYDYMVADSAASITLLVPDPGQSIWYFGVSGFNGVCNYTISITDSSDCPNSCSNHGQCYQGVCLCDAAWSGDDCSVPQVSLTPGSVISGSVTPGAWSYYSLRLPAGVSISSVTIALHETTTSGDIWLLVAEQQTATLRQYDYADTSEDASHVLHFHHDPATASTPTMYSIGVYGSPFASGSGSMRFTLVSWYPSI